MGVSLWKEFNVENQFPTRESLWTLAANMTDLAEEYRVKEKQNHANALTGGYVTVAALIVASIEQLARAQWGEEVPGLKSISPFSMCAPGAGGLFTLYSFYKREVNANAAMQCEKEAVLAITKASQTSAWRGCGLITALFKMLFYSNGSGADVVRFGKERIGGHWVSKFPMR